MIPGPKEPRDQRDEADPLAEILRPWVEAAQQAQAAAEEHERTCTVRPCERCARYTCRCGEPANGSTRCPACTARDELRDRLAPTVASVPARFRWAVDAGVGDVAARVRADVELVRRGIENPPSSWLVFTGPTGAGKTSLAVAMLAAWVRAGAFGRKGARFMEAAWLARARARYKLGEGEAPLVEQAIAAPLLVLDDLGAERDDRDGVLHDVVWERSNAERPTWITCGLPGRTLDDLAATLERRYDGGFARRVLETGKRVPLGGAR